MTCNAEIDRSFMTRDAAIRYLASRGFVCGPLGWRNGRWAASIDYGREVFRVALWLQLQKAA